MLGLLAARFLAMRGFERLGFARLGDYAAERLGWSSRQVQEIARVAAALARLPQIDGAFRRGTLSWSKTRLLACIASASDEARWLAVAAATDVRALAAATGSARAASREQRLLVAPEAAASAIDEEEQEERLLVRIPCSRRAMRLWNEARRLAPRMAGRALAQWEVAELVAAEASTEPGPFHELWQQQPWRGLSSTPGCDTDPSASSPEDAGAPAKRRRARAQEEEAGGARESEGRQSCAPHEPPGLPLESGERQMCARQGFPGRTRESEERQSCAPDGRAGRPARGPGDCDASSPEGISSSLDKELVLLDQLDAFGLDAAMRRVRRAMQRRQARLGAALGMFLDLRLHEELGYASGADYVHERLGLSDRTARELVRVARAAQEKSPALAAAYAGGQLSWLRVLALLPVVHPWNGAAWIERAGEVTLRRLGDEVAWAAERAALEPGRFAAMPPAPGQDLGHGDDVGQMCARDRLALGTSEHSRDEFWGVAGRIRVTFVAPFPVGELFRSAMQGFGSPLEPRWKAFERMLEHVLAQWRAEPRHRDPVFVHGGLARATGQAPDAIDWELGLSTRRPPLLRLRGDRYLRGNAADAPTEA